LRRLGDRSKPGHGVNNILKIPNSWKTSKLGGARATEWRRTAIARSNRNESQSEVAVFEPATEIIHSETKTTTEDGV
jgi:hypothetical protein